MFRVQWTRESQHPMFLRSREGRFEIVEGEDGRFVLSDGLRRSPDGGWTVTFHDGVRAAKLAADDIVNERR